MIIHPAFIFSIVIPSVAKNLMPYIPRILRYAQDSLTYKPKTLRQAQGDDKPVTS
jgi:hypothetical protein